MQVQVVKMWGDLRKQNTHGSHLAVSLLTVPGCFEIPSRLRSLIVVHRCQVWALTTRLTPGYAAAMFMDAGWRCGRRPSVSRLCKSCSLKNLNYLLAAKSVCLTVVLGSSSRFSWRGRNTLTLPLDTDQWETNEDNNQGSWSWQNNNFPASNNGL